MATVGTERPGRDLRPSPEALLKQAAVESRGRLKIFLGAAPGVGKTYEMLTTAQAKRQEGVDIVIGVVETHGRKETEALIQGLEVIQRRRTEYKGHWLEEMDLDGILRRRPKIVLVDELAHTNAPGSRHPKRYLDVVEILDAGIDVYATLNIQHVDSLNDVVAKITSVRVRETVPDSIIDRADDIEMVDLTPDDLIQRLKEGKVYFAQQAERAIRNYFKPGNLTALRELALRRTAQRVDEQMVSYMQAHAIEGPWAAGERVVVCVGADPNSQSVVRYARRVADRLRAPWTAIHVETARTRRLSEADRDRIAEALRLAQRLGGEAVTVPGEDVADTVLEYAREHNVTHVLVAKSRRSAWSKKLYGSTIQQLIQRSGDISLHVVAGQGEASQGAAKESATSRSAAQARETDLRSYAGSMAIIGAAVIVSVILHRFLVGTVVPLVFLVAVLASAIAYGLWPALVASLISVLAYNFFFLPPLYTFTISDPTNVVTLFFFAVVAVIASNLTSRVRTQALVARQRAKTTEDLYLFSRKLGSAITMDDLLWATAYQIALMLKVRVVLLLPEGETVSVRAGYPPEDVLDEADLAAAKWCWENNRPAGRGADTLPGAKWLFLPMRTGRGSVGVVGLDSDRSGPLLTPDQRRLLDALSDQAGLAIERINLAQDVDQAKLAAEADRLRSALLTSISHDLKTPLVSILGSITSLRAYSGSFDAGAKDQLMATIQEETERLNRFIANLLDMTRLESGAVEPNMALIDLSEVVNSAVKRAERILAGHRIAIHLSPDLPMVKLDFVLFEQVLFNLLDNAAKYSPAGTLITMEAARTAEEIRLQVMDEGVGIPADALERIFDKFYRVHATDRQRAGTGLGLAVCRGFVEAMGGRITAGNRSDRPGALFTVTLPVPQGVALPSDPSPQ